MPKLSADRVKEIGRTLLIAAGAPADEAETVARHCTSANRAGWGNLNSWYKWIFCLTAA